MTRRMKPFGDGRVVVLVVYIVAKTDSRNIDSVGQFFFNPIVWNIPSWTGWE